MKRTSMLMTSVAASLMLGGTVKPPQAAAQATPTQEEDFKTSPRVRQAADSILFSLFGKDSLTALSAKEIRALHPTLQPHLVDLALKRLVYEGRVKRRGEEGVDSLYRYYYYRTRGGGG